MEEPAKQKQQPRIKHGSLGRPDVPRQFFDSAMQTINFACVNLKKTGEALNIAVDAILVMREWNEPFATEAKTALKQIADKLKEIPEPQMASVVELNKSR